MIKFVQTRNLTPLLVHPFPSTTKHYEKVRLHMVFTLLQPLLIVLKSLLKKPLYNYFQCFSYSQLSQILQCTRTSLRLVVLVKFVICLYFKVCSKELQLIALNKEFFICFIAIKLESFIFDQLSSHETTVGIGSGEILLSLK